ncbi:MAG: hemolysin family protein [Saprospiraceae bacterium]
MEADIPLWQYFNFQHILFLEAGISTGYSIAFILALLGISAFLAASEVAFFSLSANDIEKLKHGDDTSSAKYILRLVEMPHTLLATILIAHTIVNIGIVIISDFVIKGVFEKSGTSHYWAEIIINKFGLLIPIEELSESINFLVTVVGVTSLLVLFGEITPKLYARSNNVKLAKLASSPILYLVKILSPISKFLVRWTDRLEEKLEQRSASSNIATKEEFDKAIDLTVKEGKTGDQEAIFLKNIINFGDVEVQQIMCPRKNIVGIDIGETYKDVLSLVKRSGFSRYPIYDDDLDNIVGILYSKDLLEHLDEDSSFDWNSIVEKEVVYVPESKKIDDLMRFIQKEKQHLAIVVDEFGGTSGLVSLEDIMEQIIGEIHDESDIERVIDFQKIDDNNYIFEGEALLNDVCRVLKIDHEKFIEVRGDANALAGLVLEKTGVIPKKDTEIQVLNYKIKVLTVNKRRIEKVQFTIIQPS